MEIKKTKEEIFTLVKDESKSVIIVVGKEVVSKKHFESFEEAEKYIRKKPYELLINATLVINNLMKDYHETKKTKLEENKECN